MSGTITRPCLSLSKTMLTPVPLVLRPSCFYYGTLRPLGVGPMDLVVDREKDDEAQQLSNSFPSIADLLERRMLLLRRPAWPWRAQGNACWPRLIASAASGHVMVGDQVSLKTRHLGISTLPSRKLCPKWIDPFTVQRVINNAAYMLEAAEHLAGTHRILCQLAQAIC